MAAGILNTCGVALFSGLSSAQILRQSIKLDWEQLKKKKKESGID